MPCGPERRKPGGRDSTNGLKIGTKNSLVQLTLYNASEKAIRRSFSRKCEAVFCPECQPLGRHPRACPEDLLHLRLFDTHPKTNAGSGGPALLELPLTPPPSILRYVVAVTDPRDKPEDDEREVGGLREN